MACLVSFTLHKFDLNKLIKNDMFLKDSVSSLCSYLFESTFICIKDSARGDLLGVLHVYRRLNKKSRPVRYFG